VPDILLREKGSMREVGKSGERGYVIPSDPKEARRIQDEIERVLVAHQFDEREIFSIKLALEEAIVNAMKHGNQYDRSKRVFIETHITHDRFFVKIMDEGPGFDPGDVPDPMAVENLERPCGRGLLLMRHYMSEVVFIPPGNGVAMSKLRANGVPR
jgi:serine/threonine-protein kinase RsbW